ncbi:sulfite exporter TauE/SafE family protein [Corynebacterium aurimucosum]|uniref:sulfite exporter TauE/SafE family protein n=1 Tax=Corynebacterium aurimucosum TaxID=169292 RepID=UPI00191FAF2A|nr:sulfite exporter TauE/SafE family protein [Corynebacterium aurimucosum]QQU95482.1 sulfite exporter TauE/SafE family protein [Corynebacterium aurimucosum]UTA71616.1 sulfite exporter TauE/SafE family protein [Corynebacterium aurimucosum]WJY69844.1 Sulfite exporter TauE/SafE [Corynebacterium aurimucosum]
MRSLILIAVAGAAAQLVDGGIGMGFGVTSTTILLLAGLGPATASAVVHASELGTTLVSGISHWRFGNVHWPTVLKLGVPGGLSAFIGATVLSNLSLEAAAPVTSAILVVLGINLVWRFSRPRSRTSQETRQHSTPLLAGLGVVGGFVDASGGGGWGPISTSTLMAVGREQPRRIVGTVNTAEFLVTFGATAGFIVGLWEEIVANAAAVVALLIGGVITAPIAAWLISRINPTLLGGFVGTAIVTLNIPRALGWALAHQQILLLQVAALVLGVALTVWANQRRARSAQGAEGDSTSQQRTGSRVVETAEPTGRETAHAGSSADSEDERVGVE